MSTRLKESDGSDMSCSDRSHSNRSRHRTAYITKRKESDEESADEDASMQSDEPKVQNKTLNFW